VTLRFSVLVAVEWPVLASSLNSCFSSEIFLEATSGLPARDGNVCGIPSTITQKLLLLLSDAPRVWDSKIRGRRLDAVSVRVVPAPDDVPRLKRSERENARLKKLVAERDLEIEVMKEIAARKMVGMLGRREQVAYARRRGLSQRSAAAALWAQRQRQVPRRFGLFLLQLPGPVLPSSRRGPLKAETRVRIP
jgi:hypothetical protein